VSQTPSNPPNKKGSILRGLIKRVGAMAVQMDILVPLVDVGRPSILVVAVVLDTESKTGLIPHVEFGSVADTDSRSVSERRIPGNFTLDVMTGLSLKEAELSDSNGRDCEFDHLQRDACR